MWEIFLIGSGAEGVWFRDSLAGLYTPFSFLPFWWCLDGVVLAFALVGLCFFVFFLTESGLVVDGVESQ